MSDNGPMNGNTGAGAPPGGGSQPQLPSMNPKIRVWFWIIIIGVGLIAAIGGQIVNVYTDWLWFIEISFQSVFLTMYKTKILLGVAVAVVLFLFLLINILIANLFSPKELLFIDNLIEIPNRELIEPYINKILILATLVVSIGAGYVFSAQWQSALMFLNASSFNMQDPIFNNDLSFYVFKMPFLGHLYRLMFMMLAATILASCVTYLIHRGIRVTSRGLFVSPGPAAHLSILMGLALILKAGGYNLHAFGLLMKPWNLTRIDLFGAGFADIHARLPFINILVYLALFAALLFFINVIVKGWKLPALGLGLVLIVSFFGGTVYPSIIQRIRVEPNEKEIEREFIDHHIQFTQFGFKLRDGYDIEKYEDVRVDTPLTYQDLLNNEVTLRNIRIWDHRPIMDVYRQQQALRPYYSFNDVDVDRYTIKDPRTGEDVYVQVMLAARELNYDGLPAKSWINEHITYTHGWGVVMSPVNAYTCDIDLAGDEECEGHPEFYIEDIPLRDPVIDIHRPEIYFGELQNEYIFVNTDIPAFDYPMGRENVQAEYHGTAGIYMSSFIRRLAFAARFKSINILLNTDINRDSRILFRRRIRERASFAFPFLFYDRDPYMVVGADGRLHWILDAYASTPYLPYSVRNAFAFGSEHRFPALNYIRNSVKVVVDPYNGAMDYYIVDPDDPLIQTYAKIFPDIFKDMAEMPDFLKNHIRYPLDIFTIQALIYSRYHMDSPTTFYDQEDLWDWAQELFYNRKLDVEPYYAIMRLPGEAEEEFLGMIPFTPRGKPNLSAWMAARSDYSDDPELNKYGRLLIYKFDKSAHVLGTEQAEALIDQDPRFSEHISLWGQRGSEVIRGNMLVIPIENALLYVEPIYIQSDQTRYPTIRRVAVAYKDENRTIVAIRRTLDEALQRIFMDRGEDSVIRRASVSDLRPEIVSQPGLDMPPIEFTVTRDMAELIDRAAEQYDAAIRNQQDGDWAGYGRELQALEATINQLRQTSQRLEEELPEVILQPRPDEPPVPIIDQEPDEADDEPLPETTEEAEPEAVTEGAEL